MKTSREQYISRAEKLWQKAVQLHASPKTKEEPIREPFELILAALIYHGKALSVFTEEQLHELVRKTPTPLSPILARNFKDLTAPDIEKEDMLGRMHLASAALRLPVAVLETIDANNSAEEDFQGLINKETEYWNEGKVRKNWVGDCCGPISPRQALAVLLPLRNDLVHGEISKGQRRKNDPREKQLDDTHRCRVVNAQQELISWCLDKLKRVS